MYIFTCASLSFLVQHITCAPLPFLVHHSYASYIKTLYCIVLLTSIYRKLFIILTWYQSHCSKCFVQFFVFLGILPLPQPSPILLCCHPQNSNVPIAIKGWIHCQRLTAFNGFFASSLRSKHLHHHWIDLLTPDTAAQKSPPFYVARAATCLLKILPDVTPRHPPHASSNVSPCHRATSVLTTRQP